MEDQIQIGQKEQGVMNIKDLFYKYVRFLPLFIISIALGLFVAYVYLRYATLVYTSTGSLVIQDEGRGGSSDKLDNLFESDAKKNIQNEIEYLQSRQLMRRVVDALDLNFTYIAKGNIKELNIYKSSPFRVEAFEIRDSSGFTLSISFENNNNFRINGSSAVFTYGQIFKNESGVFRLVKEADVAAVGQYRVTWEPTQTVATRYAASIAVTPKANTGILLLRLESTHPRLAADIINQLMIEYQKATIDDKNATTQNELNFIDKELDTISRQLDSITNLRLDFVKRHGLFSPDMQTTSYLTQIDQAKEQAREQRLALNNAYLVESYLKRNSSDVPVPSSLGLADPTLNDKVVAYNKAQLDRIALSKTAPPGNVTLRDRTQLVERLQRDILESLQNIKKSYTSSLSSIQGFQGSAETQIRLLPELQQSLTEIQRQLESKLAIYNSLLVKREESAIVLASTISNIKVLQEAVPNNVPVKPNHRNAQMLGALIGLLIPALFIFVLEILNDKVSTRYDVERLTSAPVIGEVGHSYADNTLVVTSNNRGVVAEQFRIVRSNLQYVLNHFPNPTILVTSSFSGEGKSFASTNVGAVMALAGKRTIVLEFDIRKPKILSKLNMPKRPGLTNYLLGKVTLDELPIPVEGYANLFVLACGPVPPNPSELLLDAKLSDLFSYLRAKFDVVIIDTAPVGMVSDAMTLSKFADCTLYIVRQGHTFKRQIGLIDEFHRDGKLPKVSIILNDVKIRTGYGYYGYGRYGYGHGYSSSYYEEEIPPPTLLQSWLGWFDTRKWFKKKKKPRSKTA